MARLTGHLYRGNGKFLLGGLIDADERRQANEIVPRSVVGAINAATVELMAGRIVRTSCDGHWPLDHD
jgi:hypothetical protein